MFVCMLLSIWMPVGSQVFAMLAALLCIAQVIGVLCLAEIDKQ